MKVSGLKYISKKKKKKEKKNNFFKFYISSGISFLLKRAVELPMIGISTFCQQIY